MLLNLPFTLPGWMPPWLFLLLALPALLWALAFLLMPFSVFGLKARLETLEEQIAALHEDMRIMTLRASGGLPPAPAEFPPYDDLPVFSRIKKAPTVHEEPMVPPPRPVQPAPRQVQPPPPPLVQPIPRTVQPLSARERLSPTPAPSPAPKHFRRTEPRLD
jgi:hypothetical protein